MAYDFPASPVTNQGFQGWVWDGEKWLRRSDGGQVRRYAYTASAAQTVISGADLNGQTLSYTIGAVEVIVNGITLPQADFTATNGTSITLGLALAAGDYVYVLVLDSFSLLNGVTKVAKQVFTTSGTYTPTPGMIYCIIECLGGGGGGGAAVSANTTSNYAGAGGGAGSYSRKYATASDIGTSKTVTIGAAGNGGAAGSNSGTSGGDTSVGVLCSGRGGGGGFFSSIAQFPNGSAGGGIGSGDFTATGAAGLAGAYSQTTSLSVASGTGGSSQWGCGGLGVHANTATTAGQNATGFGSGGGGGTVHAVASSVAGGNGTAGVVIITEFCNS